MSVHPERSEYRPASRAEHAAGFAGLLFAILMTTGLVLFNTLPPTNEYASLLEWSDQVFAPRLQIVTLYVVPFAGVAFLWFMAAIRERGSSKTDRFFDTVFLGSGLLYVAMLFGGAAAGASVVAAPDLGSSLTPDADTVRTARLFSYSFFNVYAARVAGVFTMVTSGMLLRTKLFPRWLGLLGVAIALVLLLTVSWFRFIIYLFPAWIGVVSVVYLLALRRQDRSDA